MAKVGLENDTLNPPKCPSDWEYSTGQRQLLDIQSREQMDRLSFSAQNQMVGQTPTIFIFCKLTRTSDPKLPPTRGLGGVNNSSREMPARSAGSSLVLSLIEAGKIDTTPLITYRYKLADIAEAYYLFDNKLDGVIKVTVES